MSNTAEENSLAAVGEREVAGYSSSSTTTVDTAISDEVVRQTIMGGFCTTTGNLEYISLAGDTDVCNLRPWMGSMETCKARGEVEGTECNGGRLGATLAISETSLIEAVPTEDALALDDNFAGFRGRKTAPADNESSNGRFRSSLF